MSTETETEPRSEMWINAFSIVSPSDETLRGIGQDVVNLLRSSRGRDRADEMEPLMLVNLRVVAS